MGRGFGGDDEKDGGGDVGGNADFGGLLPPLPRGPDTVGNGGGSVTGSRDREVLPPTPQLPTPEDGNSYLKEVLEPQMFSTYAALLLDEDPKIRRAAASDIAEMTGRKGKVTQSLGGITLNLAPEKMEKLVGGLRKVFAGGKPSSEEVLDV